MEGVGGDKCGVAGGLLQGAGVQGEAPGAFGAGFLRFAEEATALARGRASPPAPAGRTEDRN